MLWALRSVIQGIKDEYRGWHRFRQATGKWPVCSVLAGLLSIPTSLVAGTYRFIMALATNRLPVICATLFAGVFCGAAAWYGLRRLACKIDVAKAHKSGRTHAVKTLETLIR
jgi:hypothetical protein